MAKYANVSTPPKTAMKTTDVLTVTHEGAPAFAKDSRTELFTLAVTYFGSEDGFYETASTKDARLSFLVEDLTKNDPEFIEKLVPFLRNTAQMRSVPVMIAAEYCLAGGPNKRKVMNSAMSRADEPAEFLGYWMAKTGRKTLPGGVQRGLADATSRLYNEYAAMKYNSSRHAIRMADVIELAHPTPKAPWQNDLFKYLLDERHHGDGKVTDLMPVMRARAYLMEIPEDNRRAFIATGAGQEQLQAAGATWEFLSGWLPGGMDGEAWDAAIPNMGYMALLRNLRNFDEKNISGASYNAVKKILRDPEAVAKSRQMPFRFWSAYNATQSTRWSDALEEALSLSTQNIPEFAGTTLVLVDISGSMGQTISRKSTVSAGQVAGLFGASVFHKNPKTTRLAVFGTHNKDITPKQRGSVLRLMEKMGPGHNALGWGTELARAVHDQYRGEDRVVVFTDMQVHDGGVGNAAKFVHYFDLGGYRAVPDAVGKNGTFMYGGFTDTTFRTMALNESLRGSTWDDILG